MDDIADTLAPNSQQLDNIELADGPRTFTIENVVVTKGADQPVSVYFVGFPRPWKPGKNMRRVLSYCWGSKSAVWVGRSVTLFRDADVTFGKDRPGGTRISHLSHIDGPKLAPVLLSQGRAGTYKVEPLGDAPDAPKPPTEAAIATCTDKALLGDWWRAFPNLRDQLVARVAEIDAEGAES